MKSKLHQIYEGDKYLGFIDLMLGEEFIVSRDGIITEHCKQGPIWALEGFAADYMQSGIWTLETIV